MNGVNPNYTVTDEFLVLFEIYFNPKQKINVLL